MIGGSGTGSATQTTLTASGFANSNLTSIFAALYNTSKITNWYPYPSTNTSSNYPTLPLAVVAQSLGTPKYIAPVLAVVLGLFFLTLIILSIFLYRHRRLLRSRATQSDAGTMDNGYRIMNWVGGTRLRQKYLLSPRMRRVQVCITTTKCRLYRR